jgi:tetratricopeptide (TPR) repeat protein
VLKRVSVSGIHPDARVRTLGAALLASATVVSVAAPPAASPALSRFERGLALAKAHETAAAIAVLAALTRDYPRLPEPYVPLAALYAANHDYRQAAATLRAALTVANTPASLEQDLGDAYAALAAEAYDRAAAAYKKQE